MGNEEIKVDPYTDKFSDVYQKESAYTKIRRETYSINSDNQEEDLWGIAFSGGGIRSATFGLGVMQTLMSKTKWFPKGIFRRFDYMSTVSGGGYIGSCMSSLLTPDHEPKGFENLKKTPDVIAVEPESSPFVGLNLNDDDEDYNVPYPSNSVRHQLHHLRSYGNYLISRKSLFSVPLLRFVGTAFYGALFNTLLISLLYMCCVAVLHFTLLTFSGVDSSINSVGVSSFHEDTTGCPPASDELLYEPNAVARFGTSLRHDPLNNVVMYLGYNPDPTENRVAFSSIGQQFDDYTQEALILPLKNILLPSGCQYIRKAYIVTTVIGFLWVILWIFISDSWIRGMILMAREKPKKTTSAGETPDIASQRKITLSYVISSTLFAVGVAIVCAQYAFPPYHRMAAVLIPFFFAIGGVLSSLLVITFTERIAREMYRFTRSILASIKGATVYGLVASVVIPIAVIFGLSMSQFSLGFVGSVVAYAASFLLMQKGTTKFGTIKFKTGFWAKHYRSFLNAVLIVLLIMLIAPFTKLLLLTYPHFWSSDYIHPSVVAFVILFLLVSIICSVFDFNKLAPFNFYCDRLTEAYLQTNARVDRSNIGRNEKQGKPLRLVRNDDSLLVKDLGGESQYRSPYHLINASINMAGSDELIRNTHKSDHFLFSKYFVGSRTTGYARTDQYMLGHKNVSTLRLARAMTISGAAASSAMGVYSFAAQSFLMTLFNLRLGQWLPNPWWYNPLHKPPHRSPRYWLPYILQEMLGKSNAARRYINLSDGGHTGDNVGLFPLLQRRCKVILVVAAEVDPKCEFKSLTDALRMANIEDNIKVDIDLSHLSGDGKDDPVCDARRSIAVGRISYPEKDFRQQGKIIGKSHGVLIYLRASVSTWKGDVEEDILEVLRQVQAVKVDSPHEQESELYWSIPADVCNYKKLNSSFPNQRTGDQFFDTNQFEAYRALGEHCGRQVLKILSKIDKSS